MVVRVLNEVEVLPTKNRPKKILIEGSDGEIYPFLVKGFEDLHLDQRVEQFMTVSSEFLCGDSEDPVQCRTYRILPISQNCGLIQWVKGASSLYTVYKSFELAKAQGDDSNATETKILDSYRRKRHEILAKHGLSDSIDRLKVPPHLNVEILRSAQQDTPDNLFARFFGDEFLDAEVYAQKSRNFKRSLALNSILGYVLSLGDRHLENLLIDENTGELIHIDFNVCFDKGKRLKVPEVVPFRLTQSLVSALGVNGIDSEFKSVCESVLQSVRSNWVTLSLLLTEAFVNDPVWDWSNEIATQQESTDRETRVNTNLLKSRIGKRCILLDEIGLPGLLSDTESKRCFISACFEKMELSLDRILREVFTHHSHRQVKATLKDLDKQLKQLELSPASAYREIQDMHGELKTLLGDILSLSFKASLPIKDSWKSLDDCLSQLQKSLSSDSAQAYKSSLIALRDQLLAKNASRTFAPEPSRAVAPEDEEPTDDIEDMGESLIPSQQKEENRVVRDINAPRDTRAYAQYLMKRVEARLRGTAFQGKTITEEVRNFP